MPSSKKQKLSKDEKARRKLKSHTTNKLTKIIHPFGYSRKGDALGKIAPKHKSYTNLKCPEALMNDLIHIHSSI